jgi:hypothetical protein
MTLQEGIEFDQFVRCYCVGQEKVLIMPYDPTKPYLSGMQYVNVTDYLSPELHARVERDCVTICTALGYDLNTIEFAIKDGTPYAIDFMNPAPDAELASVGEFNHNWIVNAMTEFIFKKLETGFETPEYRWTSMLNPVAQKSEAKPIETIVAPAKTKAPAKPKAAAKKTTEKKPQAKNANAE